MKPVRLLVAAVGARAAPLGGAGAFMTALAWAGPILGLVRVFLNHFAPNVGWRLERHQRWDAVRHPGGRIAAGRVLHGRHKTAIGLTGDPVPVGRRSGAIMHRNDQRPSSAHNWLSSVNCK
jgi:hypothetical protein